MENARETTKIRAFHAALQQWYRQHGRHDLPWRQTHDPYAIYISEVMLQQTQVKTVLERYYFPFLEKFPNLESLAAAPRPAVMKAWEGLGYYSRAANLHEAAMLARDGLPQTVDALLALPGIGKNTAHAVAAFAFGIAVPVMEANVKRVLCRIFALEKADVKVLWQNAFDLLDTAHPFDYNQAMMDLGAMICTPRAPACSLCPAAIMCAGKETPENYPQKQAKKTVPIRQNNVVILRDASGRIFLRMREGAFLTGLYGFGETELQSTDMSLGRTSQTYSHFKAQTEIYLRQLPEEESGKNWFTADMVAPLALSGIDQKIWQIYLKYSIKN